MIGVSASSKAYSEVGNHSGNLNQRYIDHPRYRSKLTYLVHGNVHSSEECKFLNEFGTRYSASRTFKYIRQEPTAAKIYTRTMT